MRRTIRLAVDVTIDEHGTVHQVKAKERQTRANDQSSICFVTGQLKTICRCPECSNLPDNKLGTNRPEEGAMIEVVFCHHRDASTFTAIVSPLCTGERALQGLLAGDEHGPFLDLAPPGRPYELALKPLGIAIRPNMTLAEAGVVDGDQIEVRQGGQGAGPAWDAIQLSLAYGLGTGAGMAFIKALAPILQEVVKNKGSQSLEIEVGGKRIMIIGKNSINEVMGALKELAQMERQNYFREPKDSLRAKPRVKSQQRKPKSIGRKASKLNRPELTRSRPSNLGSPKVIKKVARNKKKLR